MKPILVIIPGWGGTRETWCEFSALAEKDFAVICVELPCFGAEPPPTTVWGVEEYSGFVKEKITKIKEQNPDRELILLGHSFGGQVAAYLVGTNPGICATLILSGPAIFRKKWSLKRLIFWPIAKVGKVFFSLPVFHKLEKIARRVLYKVIDSPDYLETSGIKRSIFQKITTADVSMYLPNISVPTLVIAGANDAYVSPSLSQRVADLIPHSVFSLVMSGRHGLHLDNPDDFLNRIKSFLKI